MPEPEVPPGNEPDSSHKTGALSGPLGRPLVVTAEWDVPYGGQPKIAGYAGVAEVFGDDTHADFEGRWNKTTDGSTLTQPTGRDGAKYVIAADKKLVLESLGPPCRMADTCFITAYAIVRRSSSSLNLIFGLVAGAAPFALITDGVWMDVAGGGSTVRCRRARDAGNTGDYASSDGSDGFPESFYDYLGIDMAVDDLDASDGRMDVAYHVNGLVVARSFGLSTKLPFDEDCKLLIGVDNTDSGSAHDFYLEGIGYRRRTTSGIFS